MAIREFIDKHSVIATVVALLLVVGGIAYIVRSATAPPPTMSTDGYYTTDEGKTVFVDALSHLPPFEHDGQTASRVWMYSCDEGKTKFPGFLERYTPVAKARIESAMLDFNSGKTHMAPVVGPGDTEVKKPGPGNPWVSRANYQEAQKIITIRCPAGGGSAEIQLP
jgi:hypothetical protein